MKHFVVRTSVAGFVLLGCAIPLLAAQPAIGGSAVNLAPVPSTDSYAAEPAEGCLNELRTFQAHLDQDGYWLGGSDDADRYAAVAWGYGYGMDSDRPPVGTGYQKARPGYETRPLPNSADISADPRQQHPCEDVQPTIRPIDKRYTVDQHNGEAEMIGGLSLRRVRID